MAISFSGLGESEACWTRRFIRGIGGCPVPISQETLTLDIGASHAPTFSKKTTHLLCPSRQGPKAKKAVEWGIPIVDTSWLESLLVSTTNSPVVEGGVNLLPPLCKDRGEGAEQIDTTLKPVLKRAFLCLSFFSLTKADKPADAEDSGGTESDPQETFPPADNSLLPEFEFHTNNFLGRSTPKKDRFLKPELPLGGDAESSSLHLSSPSTHIEGWEPVPSSRSPSPMVLKKSPGKVEGREQRAHQVIAESITTLLGKRQASKEEIVSTAQSGRATKRSRPLSRNKVRTSFIFSNDEADDAFTVFE
jgi:DNA replication regulator DPB11